MRCRPDIVLMRVSARFSPLFSGHDLPRGLPWSPTSFLPVYTYAEASFRHYRILFTRSTPSATSAQRLTIMRVLTVTAF